MLSLRYLHIRKVIFRSSNENKNALILAFFLKIVEFVTVLVRPALSPKLMNL